MNFKALSNRIENSNPLDFGSIFSKSIDLFKQVWLQGFIIVILTFLTIIPFYVLIYIPLLIAGVTDPKMLKSEEVPPEIVIPMVILIPLVFLGVMTVSLLLNAAFLRICRNKDLNLSKSDDYFHYFNKKYASKAFLLSLMILGLMVLGLLACGLGIFYLVVPISLIPAFLAFDQELSAKEIVKSSFSLGNKNWLVIFGLIVIMGLVTELGILLCFIGVFFTAMLAKIPVYFMYKDAVGFSSEP
ncbi:hypothetical protein [Maribacter arenosus]|uniref:Glycerophosphoryl diester phosphodiesterase membrane domain-containing protein n=1 Tax=Maribacter arenosus TaxID=1854708 RepID=A0ABR7VHN6_9FLAO|nr:hypothetical protein [Maribacter arenosus]MBD0851672.1 hypothetical protein [Maribacter arenosus]